MRYLLQLSYKGTNYAGWQKQQNAITVQGKLDQAISMILNQSVDTVGSGRTDKGVHAACQYAHFDFSKTIDLQNFVYRLNKVLDKEIAVSNIFQVPNDFHARFSATERVYHYLVDQRKNPFTTELATYFPFEINLSYTDPILHHLKGEWDFTTFCKAGGQTDHYRCNINYLTYEATGKKIVFKVSANRFLRGMVRLLMGALLEVAQGKMDDDDFWRILESKDRRMASAAAPAEGLYLAEVHYPAHFFGRSTT